MRVFWSYAKRDDAKPHHVTHLCKQFEIVLGQCIGVDAHLFQDITGLKWGVEWRKNLESEVKSADVFVCILSPSYFSSKMCIQEVSWATEAGVSICPILYRACPKGLKSDFSNSDTEAVKLNKISEGITALHQYVDFTSLRNLSKESPEVMNFLDKVCEQIA